jgi:hypothetical protein
MGDGHEGGFFEVETRHDPSAPPAPDVRPPEEGPPGERRPEEHPPDVHRTDVHRTGERQPGERQPEEDQPEEHPPEEHPPGEGPAGERRPEEDRAGGEAAGAGPAGQAPLAGGSPARQPDETLFAAFMAARESAMAPDQDAGPLSPRAKRWIAAALVVVFLLSLAAGYVIYRSAR